MCNSKAQRLTIMELFFKQSNNPKESKKGTIITNKEEEKLQETKGKSYLKKKVEQGALYTRFQTVLALEPLETMDKGTCS